MPPNLLEVHPRSTLPENLAPAWEEWLQVTCHMCQVVRTRTRCRSSAAQDLVMNHNNAGTVEFANDNLAVGHGLPWDASLVQDPSHLEVDDDHDVRLGAPAPPTSSSSNDGDETSLTAKRRPRPHRPCSDHARRGRGAGTTTESWVGVAPGTTVSEHLGEGLGPGAEELKHFTMTALTEVAVPAQKKRACDASPVEILSAE